MTTGEILRVCERMFECEGRVECCVMAVKKRVWAVMVSQIHLPSCSKSSTPCSLSPIAAASSSSASVVFVCSAALPPPFVCRLRSHFRSRSSPFTFARRSPFAFTRRSPFEFAFAFVWKPRCAASNSATNPRAPPSRRTALFCLPSEPELEQFNDRSGFQNLDPLTPSLLFEVPTATSSPPTSHHSKPITHTRCRTLLLAVGAIVAGGKVCSAIFSTFLLSWPSNEGLHRAPSVFVAKDCWVRWSLSIGAHCLSVRAHFLVQALSVSLFELTFLLRRCHF
ncbi:uncharacterized protein LOC110271471 [Arachis ipaensis]|uniref:uncharacterized protein LOC110271471 n=1 Tax=Arachis ipaensis TaxID=130454 RepID=UPI000A2B4015|nr:uncharacterized protein LOC110271471 [Arachis ipaensis]